VTIPSAEELTADKPVMYVIYRADGGYLADLQTWTRDLRSARIFPDRQSAAAECRPDGDRAVQLAGLFPDLRRRPVRLPRWLRLRLFS
jgi:hypothetical protein